MRFFIVGDVCLEEVIGEPVTIDQAPDEVFAVHRACIGTDDTRGLWTVSHVETGHLCGEGDSIDFAIEIARGRFASKTPDEIRRAFAHARLNKAHAVANKPIGPVFL